MLCLLGRGRKMYVVFAWKGKKNEDEEGESEFFHNRHYFISAWFYNKKEAEKFTFSCSVRKREKNRGIK